MNSHCRSLYHFQGNGVTHLVHLNPWRVRESHDPFAYQWSSLGAYAGTAVCPPWLTLTDVLSYFGKKGKRRYREFIIEGMQHGIKTLWEEVRGQAVIGTEEFVEEVAETHLQRKKTHRGEESGLRKIVAVKPESVIQAVASYFGIAGEEIGRREQRYTDARYVATYLLRRYCLMTLQEIGKVVRLHYSAVGNAIRQMREQPTNAQAKSLRELEGQFKNR